YNLKARYVIHTVGPVYKDGKSGEPELLKNCYYNSLRLAVKNNIRTIAFPSISTGAYGYPVKEAAPVAIKTVIDFLSNDNNIEKVLFVLFSQTDYDIYREILEKLI
ncbi:MAG: macro domain-containing protein, partial [Deltaproteobacteria bacterium]|nr:macro domain-containing protein [Deltaproteobacteria bacterium]